MDPKTENVKLEFEPKTLRYLNKSRKWAMFLSIIGFIINGLIIILGLLAGAFLTIFETDQTDSLIPEHLYITIVFFLALIFFFPLLSLFRYSKHTYRAVKSLNPKDFQKAFRNLKSFFVFIGILIIILLILYVGVLIAVGSTMAIPKGLL